MTAEILTSTIDELNALKAFFNSAHDQLGKGNVVDMDGIDTRVSQICQTVQKADPSHQQIYLPELATLIDLLNTYEKELHKLQTKMLSSSGGTETNGNA
jgi:hypothetical protein